MTIVKVAIEYADLSLLVKESTRKSVNIESLDDAHKRYKDSVVKLLENELRRLGGPNVSIQWKR